MARRLDDGDGLGGAELPSTGRSIGAGFILTIGAWALVAGMAGLWLRATFLNPEGFADVTVAIIGDNATGLQDQITTEVLDVAFSDHPEQEQAHRAQVEEAMHQVLSSGDVDQILHDQVAALHTAVLSPSSDEPTIDLSGIVAPVQQRLDDEGVHVTIPTEQLSNVEVVMGGILRPVRSAANFARTATLVLPVAGLLAVLAGLALSDRRLRSLRLLGINVAISAGTIALMSLISRTVVSTAMESSGVLPTGINAAWRTLSGGLIIRMAVLAVVAGVVVAGSTVAIHRSDR